MHQVDIRTRPSITVAALDHVGSYQDIGRSFEILYEWFAAHHSVDPQARVVGIYFDDPAIVPEAQLRSKACVEISPSDTVALSAPVSRLEIAGGTFAVLTHVGPYTQLHSAYRFLYGEWLPTAPYQATDAPAHEIYLNTPRDTPPAELITEIWLPIQSATAK